MDAFSFDQESCLEDELQWPTFPLDDHIPRPSCQKKHPLLSFQETVAPAGIPRSKETLARGLLQHQEKL